MRVPKPLFRRLLGLLAVPLVCGGLVAAAAGLLADGDPSTLVKAGGAIVLGVAAWFAGGAEAWRPARRPRRIAAARRAAARTAVA
ncbi:MAG: hypothetical protein IRZ04_06620 [Rhodospirillales bacterium]|nr:hypothetical protein [Rhodospirillales bacterium]